jgi:shikimate kinase/3-dehydroquinate synthase
MTEASLRRRKVILTGFMATGKSRVGAALAHRLGLRLIDTDQEVERRCGKTPAAIIVEDGEVRLRQLEREIVAELAKDPTPTVIATGGGTLVEPCNFDTIAAVGIVVCLRARPEVVAARVSQCNQVRPKLRQGNAPLLEQIRQLMAQREAAYARAEISVDTSDLSIETAAQAVLAALAQRGFTSCNTFPSN